MNTKNDFLRPVTFEPGAACFRIEPAFPGREAAILPVWFVCYDPCPAFVIVRTQDGSRQRCPRFEIYISPAPAPEGKVRLAPRPSKACNKYPLPALF